MNERDIDARLRRLPPIRRARFWRLYAEDGRRFLDLWQEGGRGVLGARHAGLGLAVKEALDRGLDRPLPSRHAARLEKLLLASRPGSAAVRLYRSEDRALAALGRVLGAEEGTSHLGHDGVFGHPLLHDPAVPGSSGGGRKALLLRPFAAFLDAGAGRASIALPLLPLPRGTGPAALLFDDPAEAERAGPSDLLPPLLLASALKALAALARYETESGEARWKRIDRRAAGLFDRKGPWLFPNNSSGNWDYIFEAALGRGILLPPDPSLPGLVPGDFDDGEIAPLAALTP